MNLGFTKLINEIEGEIKMEYLPDAINWADRWHDNAWSKAIDRFEDALNYSQKHRDWKVAQYEAQVYRATIMGLLHKYKQAKNIEETESFLKSLEEDSKK